MTIEVLVLAVQKYFGEEREQCCYKNDEAAVCTRFQETTGKCPNFAKILARKDATPLHIK